MNVYSSIKALFKANAALALFHHGSVVVVVVVVVVVAEFHHVCLLAFVVVLHCAQLMYLQPVKSLKMNLMNFEQGNHSSQLQS